MLYWRRRIRGIQKPTPAFIMYKVSFNKTLINVLGAQKNSTMSYPSFIAFKSSIIFQMTKRAIGSASSKTQLEPIK